MVVETRNSFVL